MPTLDRRLAAKRYNEGVHLTASLLNNLAVGLFVGGLVGPTAANASLSAGWIGFLTLFAFALHMLARVFLRNLVSED